MKGLVFSAGPARAPREVVKRVADRVVRTTPCSLLEVSDRSAEGRKLLSDVKALVIDLLSVPESFEVLILPGGGSQQFAIAALNLREYVSSVTFLITDHWTERARSEFGNFLETIAAPVSHQEMLYGLFAGSSLSERGAVFLTTNNTASGSRWPQMPSLCAPCRIFDMSSDLFACRPNFDLADLIIAAGQKNFGVAGLSLVLIRKSILSCLPDFSGVFSYRSWYESEGLYNTFPVVNLAVMLEFLRYIRDVGGVEAIGEKCRECSDMLYAFLDKSVYFEALVPVALRSPHNVVFKSKIGNPSFVLASAEARKIQGLKGHPSTGGFRASFYVGAELQESRQLVEFLDQFE